jgi:hypothetical protein
MKVWNSGLTYTIYFSGSPELEVDTREFESITRLLHSSESIGLVLLRREEITVALIISASDSSTELMELRKSESLCRFYTHDRRIGIIDPYFYYRCRRKYVDLILVELLHDSIFLLSTHLAVDESDRELREDRRESDLHLDGGGDVFF